MPITTFANFLFIMRHRSVFLVFTIAIAALLHSCNEPEAVVEQQWSPAQPKLVSYYIEEDGVKIKVKEEKFYVDGKTEYVGDFDAQGNRQGEWRYYYEDGQLWSIGNYDHGKKTGRKEVYWPDGHLRYEGFFANDHKTGVWIFYKPDGSILEQREFLETDSIQ